MYADLIEQTRQSLIEQHGENSTIVVNGKSYKKINQYLNSFEEFIAVFNNFIEINNLDLSKYDNALNRFFIFFQDAEYDDIVAVTNYFKAKIGKAKNGSAYNGSKLIKKLFIDIDKVDEKKFNYYQVKLLLYMDLHILFKNDPNLCLHTKFGPTKRDLTTL